MLTPGVYPPPTHSGLLETCHDVVMAIYDICDTYVYKTYCGDIIFKPYILFTESFYTYVV